MNHMVIKGDNDAGDSDGDGDGDGEGVTMLQRVGEQSKSERFHLIATPSAQLKGAKR